MGLIVLIIFICCGYYAQTRGKVRHESLSRMITDHSNLFSPINCLNYGFSKVENTPYLSPKEFPDLQIFEDNWEVIKEEAMTLYDNSQITASAKLNDVGFNSFFKTGWKRFYLKWYETSLPSAQKLCPETVRMIESSESVKGAMFAMLPSGSKLVKHRDPYAGSLRYHLGLVTANSPDCYLCVDGERYHWKDGEAILFDETFIHFAENQTSTDRIILFLDVKRPVSSRILEKLNQIFSATIMAASTTDNLPGDRVGFLNRAFGPVYKIRLLGKRIKAFNVTIYYALTWLLYGLLVYLLFFELLGFL